MLQKNSVSSTLWPTIVLTQCGNVKILCYTVGKSFWTILKMKELATLFVKICTAFDDLWQFAKSDFSLFQLTNDIRQEIHKKLSKACGDTLFCDISDMEAVCSDILDDTNSISRVKRQTQQRRRRLRKNGKNRNRRIKILFKMLGKFMSQCKKVYTHLGRLIWNTQCGNFRIFQPLRFYMKSILVILNPQKLPF